MGMAGWYNYTVRYRRWTVSQERLFPPVPERKNNSGSHWSPEHSSKRRSAVPASAQSGGDGDGDARSRFPPFLRIIWPGRSGRSSSLSTSRRSMHPSRQSSGSQGIRPPTLRYWWRCGSTPQPKVWARLGNWIGSATSMMPTAGSAVECRSTITCSRISVWRTARPSMP